MPLEILYSALESALGRPVISAAPRSAANSRYRDSAWMSRNEIAYTIIEARNSTRKPGPSSSSLEPPPKMKPNWTM